MSLFGYGVKLSNSRFPERLGDGKESQCCAAAFKVGTIRWWGALGLNRLWLKFQKPHVTFGVFL